jgi:catechol 2,3-dioxygenase
MLTVERSKPMSQASEESSIIRPTLHHFGLTTANLEEMVDWYTKVLRMVPTHQSSTPMGPHTPSGVRAVWVTNDKANHRIGLIALPGLTDDQQRRRHHRLQHVAFELPTIDDLLSTYTRLKGLGIEPVVTADHGATTAFYYEDPDRNSVELSVDNFGDWEKSSEYMRTSPEFAANPMGTYIDPERMIEARAAGMSVDELHKRAYAGEFPPPQPVDPRVMM